MQSYLTCQNSNNCAKFIYLEDNNKVSVKVTGVYRLRLESGFYLDLDETFCKPFFKRNLIYVSYLDKSG